MNEKLVLVRAYCALEHSWTTMATIRRTRPKASRHDVIEETLDTPACPHCQKHFVRYQNMGFPA